MGLLRSEIMKSGTLLLPVQGAKQYIERLGRAADIQFEDMNAREMRRPYRKYVQRIDEMERILRFVTEEIGKLDGGKIVKNRVDAFFRDSDKVYNFQEVEDELKRMYEVYQKFKENNVELLSQKAQAEEDLQVALTAKSIYGERKASSKSSQSLETPLMEDVERKVGTMAGVVTTVDQMKFERALWRATRGNAYAEFFPISSATIDPKDGLPKFKSVFVIFFQGLDKSYMQTKVQKVCQAFSVNLYKWPASAQDAAKAEQKLKKDLRDKKETYAGFQALLKSEAEDVLAPAIEGGNSKIEDWRLFCVKEKAVYNILNSCKGDINLQVDIWYPASDESKIQSLLKSKDMELSGHLLPDQSGSKGTPPTFLKVNDYNELWQEVICTYGIPTYREANPALLTTITFPFIFGMMYGDVGHGSLLTLVGIWLCWKGEMFKYDQPSIYLARYVILAMGIFATYAGFIYNDFFSVGLQLFPTSFEPVGDGNFVPKADYKPYPFGLDWAWMGTSNELLFVNSLKMKLSVLFGVLQMIVGVVLKWSNALYEGNFVDFILECIPMMMFMTCFFGFMDVMILYKWTHPIDNPPSIINSLICMAMGQKDDFPLWDGSVELAQKLMKITAITVPWMLLPKPFVLLYLHKKKSKKLAQEAGGPVFGGSIVDEESHGGGHGGHGHGEEFEFGEVFIHQIIETIEFVLGTVSHTASYLRIWALSLAHQQLSLVFFQKTLTMGFNMDFPMNGIVIYCMFAAWFGITLGVLMGMDVLECFLHTLRLHWVEFQSKFYKGQGVMFASFSIDKLLRAPTDE
jgi:V-type H+-transporting ATPase subunit a